MPKPNKHDFVERGSYHVYNQCVSGINFFTNPFDVDNFLNKFHKYFDGYMALCAYCLMPNHFHLIVHVRDHEDILDHIGTSKESKAIINFRENNLSINDLIRDQFRRFISSVTWSYKRKNKHRGPIFIEKTKHVLLRTEHTLLEKICYVHRNPSHHGFTTSYEDWNFSSYQKYFGEEVLESPVRDILSLIGQGDVNLGKSEFLKMHRDLRTMSEKKLGTSEL